MLVSKYRDLTLLKVSNDKTLTIACDSCGGIGNSELDVVKVEEEVVGYFTTRVCLFETLCAKSIPTVIINNLCVEMNGRGAKILKGIKKGVAEYNELDFGSEILDEHITGSTEENIPTLQTALGLTIIGEKNSNDEIINLCVGDIILSIGIPKIGGEVLDDIETNKEEIVSFSTIKTLINNFNTKDLLPVGSKGIFHEISEIEKSKNVKINIFEDIRLDMRKSAGPSTVILLVVDKSLVQNIKNKIKEPVNIIGEIIRS